MGDPRVRNVDGFTTVQHHTVPEYLHPGQGRLPDGYTACIIGASAGIGEHIAYAFATAHASTIILCARNTSKLDRVADHITSTICSNYAKKPIINIHECDLADTASVEALAAYIQSDVLEKGGRLDAMIPNASYAPPIEGMKVTENSPELVRKAFDTNFLGVYAIAHHFVPILLESRNQKGGAGHFFVIGSIAGSITKGIIANTGYTISKMAQTRLVEYIAVQYGKEGILAVTIHPGSVLTDMAIGNTPEGFMPYLIDEVGLCGAVVTWLAGMKREEVDWLGGRMISANWDMKELMEKREAIVEKDLLKFEMITR
ncbi:Dehydrogenase/ SDR family member 7B [Cyphellophora attinorum]|uniref:Dehydrogenase/ SDR family member 7B n=1 Tax=Cyphellophora attinorum TaxID=1664694 RepID=A0A0N0NHL4_9EURO|nr:Dehydrogenase/ SDR family member 7B [Phialophora attinorum]KPI34821.1 Dehydrogenase/ SDR family member 7B [Phialophora attinorum]